MVQYSVLPVATFVLGISAGVAGAVAVIPTSYDMPNGYAGDFKYYDESYSGEGRKQFEGFALTGGLGDLVDGYIETKNWDDPSVEPAGGAGPYVGWERIHPTIVFHFSETIRFASMTFWLDDRNGQKGVAVPESITVNGVNRLVPDPVGEAAFGYTFDLAGVTTNTLTAQIFRSDDWVFLSEVTFNSAAVPVPPPETPPVPLPATAIALLTGLLGLLGLRRT